jgi:hypothetical protein
VIPTARRGIGPRVAAGVAAAFLGLGAAPTVRAAPRAGGVPDTVTLASQSPWVGPGQEFQIRIHVGPTGATAGTIVISVFSSVPDRFEFTRTLDNGISEALLARPIAAPLSSLSIDPGRALVIRIALQDPTQPRDYSKLLLPRPGVYPLRIEVRPDTGVEPLVLVTHIVYLAGPITGSKLNVSWIVPVHSAPQPGRHGVDTLSPDDSARLATLAAALDAHRDIPIVLRPTPDTVSALAESSREADRATLASLARPEPGRQLLATTYVPVSLPAMLRAGLADEATAELTRGGDLVAAALNLRPDGRTWVDEGPVDEASAAFLRGSQVDRLVVPDGALSESPIPVTLARPFELAVREGTQIRAASADTGLAAHFVSGGDPVLAAHQLLADLSVIYLDSPGLTRGVIIDTARSWAPDAASLTAFLGAFLDGLGDSPILTGATLDTVFGEVPVATVRRGVPMIRTLVRSGSSVDASAGELPTAQIRAARRRLDSFGSALEQDNPLYPRLERVLLTTESTELVGARSRQGQVDLLNRLIDDQLRLIQLPTARTITLTARTGKLPITILSLADYPMRIVLKVDSDKLSFPGTSATGNATEVREIRRGNNPVDFTVRARTTGAFPLHIELSSPDARLILASTTFTVQSTALSGVGLVLSIGAGVFLAGWWGRHALQSRRRRAA